MFNPGSHSHLIMFFAEATADKYMEAISLLKQSLFNVEFTEERAKTVISQLLNSIPSEKLSASKIVNSLSDNMFFNDRSNIYHASFLRKFKCVKEEVESNEMTFCVVHVEPERDGPGIKTITRQVKTRGQFYKAHFGINNIKNGFVIG